MRRLPVSTAKANQTELSSLMIASDWLRVTAVVLAVIGLLVAGYMSWAELTDNTTACVDAGSIDCEAVQSSAYAQTFGIPVAILGFLGYVAILGVLVLEDQVVWLATYGRTLVVGMALFGVLFQIYLTYIEAAVLEKWCQWCVTSFVVISALLVVSAWRLHRFLQPLRS